MPHVGYAGSVMNDGPGFHSDIPVSELTECDTRAIHGPAFEPRSVGFPSQGRAARAPKPRWAR